MENKTPKDDLVVTSFVTKSRDQRLALPTSSSKLIVYPDGSSKAKATGRALIASFWEDVGIAVQKAHDVISVEDVEPLKGKPPFKLMLSHVLVSIPYVHLCFLLSSFFYFLLLNYYLLVIAGARRVLLHLTKILGL